MSVQKCFPILALLWISSDFLVFPIYWPAWPAAKQYYYYYYHYCHYYYYYSLRKTKVFSKNTSTFPINWQRCNSPFDLVTHVPLGEKLAAMGSFNWAIHTLIKLLCDAFDANLHIKKCDNVNIVMIWTVSTLSKKYLF